MRVRVNKNWNTMLAALVGVSVLTAVAESWLAIPL
jgi:hypothetical protein